MDAHSTYLEISMNQKAEAFSKGYRKRDFIPHQAYFLPKCGPDGYQQAKSMGKQTYVNACWEILLYAISPVIDEFHTDLFFDSDILYHEQQFGRMGHIATVNLYIDQDRMYTNCHQSDLVQRISRRRDLKTRVEKVFAGWNSMLWNAILTFAQNKNLKEVYSPTADFARVHTDKKRVVQRELFDRIYDRDVNRLFNPVKQGDWWRVDVEKHRHQIIQASCKKTMQPKGKTICICHDVERGLGHLDVDPPFAHHANATAPLHLSRMLKIEHEAGIKTSYNVVGSFLGEVKEPITEEGHCLAFHSYNHEVGTRPSNFFQKMVSKYWEPQGPPQLKPCREVDGRLKGYRPPQSRMTSELRAENLCHYNFEWLASSVSSIQSKTPMMKNRIVYIPIHFDDFPLYRHGISYDDWEKKALECIEASEFVSFGLHDCYGEFWLPHYQKFIEKVKQLGQVKTFDEIASEVILASSQCH